MDRPLLSHDALIWGLGTFHTSFLLTSLVAWLHLGGGLGNLLGALDTRLGLLLFSILWVTTTWSTREALRRLGNGSFARAPSLGQMVTSGALWGGANGVLFLLAVLALLLLASILPFTLGVVSGGSAGLFGFTLPALVIYSLIAALVASILGAVIGFFFSLLDAVLVGIAHYLLRKSGIDQ